MHLFSKQYLAASSGIVGASGPAAAGFGLAAEILRPGAVAVAFFGEGTMNQGMMMESINLAAAWNLPVLFVASVSAIIGIFFMRYDLVVVGFLVPHFHGMGVVDLPHLYSYIPSMHEILITLGGIGLCVLGFLMGERLFRGHLSEDH